MEIRCANKCGNLTEEHSLICETCEMNARMEELYVNKCEQFDRSQVMYKYQFEKIIELETEIKTLKSNCKCENRKYP